MSAYNFKPKNSLKLPGIFHFNFFTLKSILLVIIILSLMQLYFSNKFVTDGNRITQATQKAQALAEENSVLNNQIQQLGSLARIETKAIATGFVPVPKYEYLDLGKIVASR